MAERTLPATQFRARCFTLLDDVAATRRSLVVTKHRQPVARVVAVDDELSLRGSVRFLVDDDALIEPLEP